MALLSKIDEIQLIYHCHLGQGLKLLLGMLSIRPAG